MEKRLVLVLPNMAFGRLIDSSKTGTYFDSMYVRENFRRKGIATNLLNYAILYICKFPDLDIRHQSVVAQRIAKKTGYQIVGPSNRYQGCMLWRNTAQPASPLYTNIRELAERKYFSSSRLTIVKYLSREYDN